MERRGGRKVKKCEKYCVSVGCRVPIIEERRKRCVHLCVCVGGGGGGGRGGACERGIHVN